MIDEEATIQFHICTYYVRYTLRTRDSIPGIGPVRVLNKFSQYLVFGFKNSLLSLQLIKKVVTVNILKYARRARACASQSTHTINYN